VRWQSAAATPLFTAERASKSGVALCFPPQSKKADVECAKLKAAAAKPDAKPAPAAALK
jgi:hypothetical protein